MSVISLFKTEITMLTLVWIQSNYSYNPTLPTVTTSKRKTYHIDALKRLLKIRKNTVWNSQNLVRMGNTFWLLSH